MRGIDDLPTLPNSPSGQLRVDNVYSPESSNGEWSEVDMLSSIESLARLNSPCASTQIFDAAPADAQMKLRTSAPNTSLNASISSSSSQYDFIMPSLPQSHHNVEDLPTVGMLHLAVAGPHVKTVTAAISLQMYNHRKENRQDGMEINICSTSPCERDNVVLVDADFAPKDVPKWLEVQLQTQTPINLVFYTVNPKGPDDADIAAMLEIQKMAELVVVMAIDDDEDAAAFDDDVGDSTTVGLNSDKNNDKKGLTDLLLNKHGITAFSKRIWRVDTRLVTNWDMTLSSVESSNYRSMVHESENNDLHALVTAVVHSSGRIRGAASRLQARWFQSQLVVTIAEPSESITSRGDLRRKSLDSIGDVDPLGIANWSSIPKFAVAVGMGVVISTLIGLGVELFFSVNYNKPTPKKTTIFNYDNWPQWLF